MILCLDVGNTFIKYQLWNNGKECLKGCLETVRVDRLKHALGDVSPRKIIMSSVSYGDIDKSIDEMFPGAELKKIVSTKKMLGVTNGYQKPEQLGVDRWLVAVEAFQRSGSDGCAVFDLGTAITLDIVDGGGKHEGGFIVPGLSLMRLALVRGTEKILVERELDVKDEYGRSTGDAVNAGIIRLVVSWMSAEIDRFRCRFPEGRVFLAGGDSMYIKRFFGQEYVELCPDLILDALKRLSAN